MGNSHGRRSGLRLLRNGDCSYRIQLGESATIDLQERDFESQGMGFRQTWKVTYTVEGLSCTLNLVKTTDENKEELEINITDNTYEKIVNDIIERHSESIRDTIRTAEAGLLDVTANISGYTGRNFVDPRRYKFDFPLSQQMLYLLNPKKAPNAWGGVTETTINQYGEGTRKGLIVREWKKKRGDEKPFMGTVAHYYVHSRAAGEGSGGSNKIDIGLSVEVKIQVLEDGHLDFVVDGPVQHPASALTYMIEEVSRTKNWKPTACPHCARIQREQRGGGLFSQSETETSEDSDSLLPLRFPPRPTQNTRSVLANEGAVRGNNNGNFIVRRLFCLEEDHFNQSMYSCPFQTNSCMFVT